MHNSFNGNIPDLNNVLFELLSHKLIQGRNFPVPTAGAAEGSSIKMMLSCFLKELREFGGREMWKFCVPAAAAVQFQKVFPVPAQPLE